MVMQPIKIQIFKNKKLKVKKLKIKECCLNNLNVIEPLSGSDKDVDNVLFKPIKYITYISDQTFKLSIR